MLAHSVTACRSGVERVHFLDGGLEGVVLKEVFSTLGSGTMVHADPFENIRPMREEDIPDVLRIMEPLIQQGNLVRRTEDDLQRRLRRLRRLRDRRHDPRLRRPAPLRPEPAPRSPPSPSTAATSTWA